jgi:hypothetical protein
MLTQDTRPRSRPTYRARVLLIMCPRKLVRAQGRPGGRSTRGCTRKRNLRERVNHRYGGDHTGLPCAVVYGL